MKTTQRTSPLYDITLRGLYHSYLVTIVILSYNSLKYLILITHTSCGVQMATTAAVSYIVLATAITNVTTEL